MRERVLRGARVLCRLGAPLDVATIHHIGKVTGVMAAVRAPGRANPGVCG
ncbi:hypothetical protein [Actinacidiphila sp. bgisy160]